MGDFVLQFEKDANRESNILILLRHSLVVSTLSYVICGAWTLWIIPVTIFITHSIIDFVKANFKKKTAYLFILDQAAHFAVIITLVLIISIENSIYLFWVEFLGNDFIKLFIIISGGVAVLKAGSILIGLAVEPFLKEIEEFSYGKEQQGEYLSRGLKKGGNVIGQLERGLIFIFVLVGQPSEIGFLIAAKSILRFGEIRDSQHRREAEYIIIGTFMSFGYGILTSYATNFF